MKLNQVKILNEGTFLTDKQDIREWLDKHHIVPSQTRQIFLTADGVNIHAIGFSMIELDHTAITHGKKHLPIKFHEITAGDFRLNGIKIQSLEGCPDYVKGDFIVINCELDNLKFIPKFVGGSIIFKDCTFSLEGIADYLEHVGKKFEIIHCNITGGGLGLVMCDGLRHGKLKITGTLKQSQALYVIIGYYLGKPDQIFDCQNELIDAGLEEYAQL